MCLCSDITAAGGVAFYVQDLTTLLTLTLTSERMRGCRSRNPNLTLPRSSYSLAKYLGDTMRKQAAEDISDGRRPEAHHQQRERPARAWQGEARPVLHAPEWERERDEQGEDQV